MAKTATISSKGQITLPKELRDKYHLQEGETAVVVDAGEGILVKRRARASADSSRAKIDLKGFEADVRKLRKRQTL